MKDVPDAGRLPFLILRLRRCPKLFLAAAFIASLCVNGCQKQGGDGASGDPQIDATLAQLTRELHHAMVGRKINRDFDEFVALQHLEVPPPPAGKKYAINEKWKVILVDKKS